MNKLLNNLIYLNFTGYDRTLIQFSKTPSERLANLFGWQLYSEIVWFQGFFQNWITKRSKRKILTLSNWKFHFILRIWIVIYQVKLLILYTQTNNLYVCLISKITGPLVWPLSTLCATKCQADTIDIVNDWQYHYNQYRIDDFFIDLKYFINDFWKLFMVL